VSENKKNPTWVIAHLDVSVDNTLLVQVRNGLDNLTNDVGCHRSHQRGVLTLKKRHAPASRSE
jgi:hypothetical protein